MLEMPRLPVQRGDRRGNTCAYRNILMGIEVINCNYVQGPCMSARAAGRFESTQLQGSIRPSAGQHSMQHAERNGCHLHIQSQAQGINIYISKFKHLLGLQLPHAKHAQSNHQYSSVASISHSS